MASMSRKAANSSPSPILPEQVPLIPSQQALSSIPRTFANLVLCIIGSGVLGLPYTFSTVGWVMGILLLVLSGAIAYHGMMLQVYSKRRLHRCHGMHLVIASFGDLMFHAFGNWGLLAIDIMLTLSTFAGAISYVTFISQNVASVASGIKTPRSGFSLITNVTGNTELMHAIPPLASRHQGVSVFPSLESLDRAPNIDTSSRYSHGNLSDMSPDVRTLMDVSRRGIRALGFASLRNGDLKGLNWYSSSTYAWMVFPLEVALSAIPSVTLLAPFSTLGDALNLAALATIMVSDVGTIKKNGVDANMTAIESMMAMPSAFGVGLYSFQSSAIMIPIEAAMEEPLKVGPVMGMAFVFSGVIYIVFAMLGYAAFGQSTEQIITLNLQSGTEAVLIKAAISFALFLAIPLVLNPTFELVERRFSQRKMSLVLRALVVLGVCLLATTVKQFTDFLSLVGSSISCLVGFILPAAIHIKVMKEDHASPATRLTFFADVLLIVFGLVFGAFGTTISFLKLF